MIMKERRRTFLLAYGGYGILSLIIFIADVSVKGLVLERLRGQEAVRILGDLLRLNFVRNTGAAFGILPGFSSALTAFTIAAILGVLWFQFKTPAKLWRIQLPLALILGGALGNLHDRLRYGWVVDFIDIGAFNWRWPAFNLADAAISTGVFFLVILILFGKEDLLGGSGQESSPSARDNRLISESEIEKNEV